MLDDEDLLPLSGIQHLVFCERQCALIHVDGAFEENAFTVEGHLLHESVDSPGRRVREGVRVETDVWLRSSTLGLIGRADRVETWDEGSVTRVQPVESKRSRRKSLRADCVQLCAQAMALEEMRGTEVTVGELYYVNSRRRVAVAFTPELRAATRRAALRFHELVRNRESPPPRRDARCPTCSLERLCLPSVFDPGRRVERYLAAAWADVDPR